MLKIGRFILYKIFLILNLFFLKINYLIFSLRFYGILLIRVKNFLNYDIKLLIAYSSLIYINLINIILFSLIKINLKISFFILIFHSLNSLMLFFFVGILYNLYKNRNFILIKGNFFLIDNLYLILFFIIYFNLNRPIFIGFLREIILLIFLFKFLNF
jgi:NADH:ubiquinone oxidoreductase subunit 4 (subunit M)